MITEKNATAINNSGLGVKRYSLEMTPAVFKVFYSSLYEDKELAVLRELVSNGEDGHKALGLENTPVVVHLPTELVPELIITDKGIGMSLEDIEQIYTVYGKSSKNTDNNEIGGFGYGAKSPFAIASSFTVESTKNGITTTVVNFIDEDGPNYTVVSSIATDNPSGTIVKVPVSDPQIQKELASKATGGLFSLWETQPEIKNAGNLVAKQHKIIEKNDTHYIIQFNANQYGYSLLDSVSCGPFIYKIPVNLFNRITSTPEYQFLESVQYTARNLGVANNGNVTVLSRFGIGELELSPSRERIEDTKDNEDKIRKRLKEITDSLSVPAVTPEKNVEIATEIFTTHGVKLSEFVGTIDNDHVIAFKNKDEILKKLLPKGWKLNLLSVAAVIKQRSFSLYHTNKEALPSWVKPYLVYTKNIATTRVVTYGYVDYEYNLPSIGSILSYLYNENQNPNEYASSFIINQLGVQYRSGRNYRKARHFIDNQTIIVVSPKHKAIVSRCDNHATTGWVDPFMVFTDDIAADVDTLTKVAKTLDIKFNFVFEDDVRKLLKTIPKVKRTSTASVTSAPVDRRIARKLFSKGSMINVLESEIQAVLKQDNTLLFLVSDINRLDYTIDNDTLKAVNALNMTILFVSKKEYSSKKYITTVVDSAKTLANVTVIDTDSYEVGNEVNKAAAKLTNGLTVLEEIIAISVIDKKAYTSMYPNAVIDHASPYLHRKNSFGSFLSAKKADILLRCKWSGYNGFHDVKTLSDVMTPQDCAEIKKYMTEYTKQFFKF